MTKGSKKYRRNVEKLKHPGPLPVPEAVDILKKFEGAKFDETVEVVLKLGIDPKNTAQAIRGAFSLPHGVGRDIRVIAFAEGDAASRAKASGAIEVGGEDLAKKILDGWLEFDVAVAHPSMMRHVGKLGRVLGPHGKMPSPKSGTVAEDVGQVVKEFRAGKVEFRTDAGGIVHARMGKKSFAKEKIVENVHAFVEHVRSLRPTSAKGVFIQKAVISTTMSPGVPVLVT